MCELMVMSCRYPARLTRSLRALAEHARSPGKNRDGWGLAYHVDDHFDVYREVEPADESLQLRWLEQNGPATCLSLGYIRHATHGSISLENTGPYLRTLHQRPHLFAHNGHLGKLSQSVQLKERFQPQGKTDSEFAFCMLLERLSLLSPQTYLDQRLGVVAEFAQEISRFGPANFLYADGDLMFVYADRRLQSLTGEVAAPALYRLECPTGRPSSLQRDCQLSGATAQQQMLLFSSRPLTDEKWLPMPEGEVLAVRKGEILAVQML